jgi:hypothetical protein
MIKARAAQPRKLDGPPRGFSSQRLRELFAAVATGGSGTGESARDPTMDAGLVGRTLTRDSVDIIFAKARAVGATVLHYDEFVSACAAVSLHVSYPRRLSVFACSPALTGSERPSVGSAVACLQCRSDTVTLAGTQHDAVTGVEYFPSPLRCDHSAAMVTTSPPLAKSVALAAAALGC